MDATIRKTIDLPEAVLAEIKEQAGKEKRNIKNYIEIILCAHAMKLRSKKQKLNK